MPPIRDVLVPLDGSRAAEAALDQARAVARPLGGRIHLVRIVAASDRRAKQDPVRWKIEKREAEAELAEAARRLRDAGFEADDAVLAGRPAAEIVAYARRNGLDLVVLTRVGEGGSRGAPMGGTAHEVVHRIGTSVLLVDPGSPTNRGEATFRRVAVPVDGSSISEWALHTAASLLTDGGGELLAARIADPGAIRGREKPRRDAEALLARVRRQLTGPRLRLETTSLPSEEAAKRLHALADERDVDLVVLSAHGRSSTDPWPYDGLATNLLLHGRCSTLVLQDQPESRRAEPPERDEPVRPARVPSERTASTPETGSLDRSVLSGS